MWNPKYLLVVLLSFLPQSVGANDKPSAKPSDARRAALVKAGYTAVPLTLGPQGLWFVDGTVRAEKVRFLLDSGYWNTLLDMRLAKLLKLELGEESSLGSLVGQPTYIPSLMIGPYDTRKDWPNLNIFATDLSSWPGAPGCVLGMETLEPWAAVVDYPTRTLYLRTPFMNAWPHMAGTWTVTSWQEEGQARKLDPKAPPTFIFADHRLKLTHDGQTHEYAIRFGPQGRNNFLLLIDPKQVGNPDSVPRAGGLIKMAGGRMTACLALDISKAMEPPVKFAAPKGSGLVLLELKRISPDLPKPTDPIRELLLKEGYTSVVLIQRPDMRIVDACVGQHDFHLEVDTGAGYSVFDAASLEAWGAKRLRKVESDVLGGPVKGYEVQFRGLTVGGYDTRRSFAVVNGLGVAMADVNRKLAKGNLPKRQGVLGNQDLLNGSAVIDFGTNTLYLKPIKKTLWPQLEGKWVGMAWESNGNKGRYAPKDAAIEFKDGRVRFVTSAAAAEWGFHLRDEGDRYRVGLFDPKADEMADGFKYTSGGLLKLADGKLTLVMQQGQASNVPTEFAAPKGSGLLLVEYERAK